MDSHGNWEISDSKNNIAKEKGYQNWEEMENFIIDNNKSVVVAQLLVSAMEEVIYDYITQTKYE